MQGKVQSWVQDAENCSCKIPESLDMLNGLVLGGPKKLGVAGALELISLRGAPFGVGGSQIVIRRNASIGG